MEKLDNSLIRNFKRAIRYVNQYDWEISMETKINQTLYILTGEHIRGKEFQLEENFSKWANVQGVSWLDRVCGKQSREVILKTCRI